MKRFFKYSLCLVVLLSFMGVLFSAVMLSKKPVTVEQLQSYKSVLPWKPEDIIAFQTNGESKDGTLKFGSYLVLDQPPKDKDAAKTAKDLEKFKAKYTKKGTVPFKIMVDIELIQKKDNKKVRFLKGKSDIYVLNEADKKVALKDKVDNAKLCPTWGGGGGYLGEVPMGNYIVVVAYEYEKDKFIGECYSLALNLDDMR